MLARSLALLAVLITATLAIADDPKLPDVKAFDKLVIDSLRDVHNAGADLYNMSKDFSGTYRMYHGALLTVRPLLGHRPAAQKIIDDGLASAEKETGSAQKAFKLHEAIEGVRTLLKGEPVKKPEDKKTDDKSADEKKRDMKKEEKKPEPKKTEDKKGENKQSSRLATSTPNAAGGGPGLRGQITLKGQPLKVGDVLFVSLNSPRPKVFSAVIQVDGQYAPMEVVPPGKYVIVIQSKDVPEKYHLTTTSQLVVEVSNPPNVFDFALQP